MTSAGFTGRLNTWSVRRQVTSESCDLTALVVSSARTSSAPDGDCIGGLASDVARVRPRRLDARGHLRVQGDAQRGDRRPLVAQPVRCRRSCRHLDVLQANLASGDELVVSGAADLDLPELLRAALVDR